MSLRSRLLLFFSLFLGCANAFAKDVELPRSYLRANEHIVCIGDSITEFGWYVDRLRQSLNAIYPDGNIKVVAHGSGGKTAAAGVALLTAGLVDKPTLAFVMFGVNDTGWTATGGLEKAAAFVANLQKIVQFGRQNGIEMVLVKESPFGHTAATDPWVDGVNGTLNQLLAAEDAYAAQAGVPVVDAHGGYIEAQQAAWKIDPAYEFTPDAVHPILPGASAIAGALLSAVGAGLPLVPEATSPRGALRGGPTGNAEIQIEGAAGQVSPAGSIPLKASLKFPPKTAASGQVILQAGPWSMNSPLTTTAGTQLQFPLPMVLLGGNGVSQNVQLLWVADGKVSLTQSFVHAAPLHNLGLNPKVLTDEDMVPWTRPAALPCPLQEVSVARGADKIVVDFTWNDATPVAAQAGYKNRYGTVVPGPVDPTTRLGDLPCDAIDFLFDLRPAASAGRPTSDVDSVPGGVVRVTVYLTGDEHIIGCATTPAREAGKATVVPLGGQHYRLTLSATPEGRNFGLGVGVTDAEKFGVGGALAYCPRGALPLDPMGFLRLSPDSTDYEYRVGY